MTILSQPQRVEILSKNALGFLYICKNESAVRCVHHTKTPVSYKFVSVVAIFICFLIIKAFLFFVILQMVSQMGANIGGNLQIVSAPWTPSLPGLICMIVELSDLSTPASLSVMSWIWLRNSAWTLTNL